MSMQTYSFPERQPKTDGPWRNEPDKAQWIDRVTDLDCLIVRNHMGNLCGYVGVMPGHEWHGVDYDKIEPQPDVHGDLTYSAFCMEGAETGPGVCHVPAPGRPANVWWLGFDCGHFMDVIPSMLELRAERDLPNPHPGLYGYEPKYRDFQYVISECTNLARQIAAPRA